MKRIPRPAGALVWTVGAVALYAAVPFQLSRLSRARPASTSPVVRGAGLVTVAAGGALMAWAFAAHCQRAPQGWPLESGLTPGYLLRQGPYRLIRNPIYAGEALAWAGWGLVYASPAVWAGAAIMGTGLATTVRWEERRLLQRFGEDYRAYLAEVPRWVPGSVSCRTARSSRQRAKYRIGDSPVSRKEAAKPEHLRDIAGPAGATDFRYPVRRFAGPASAWELTADAWLRHCQHRPAGTITVTFPDWWGKGKTARLATTFSCTSLRR